MIFKSKIAVAIKIIHIIKEYEYNKSKTSNGRLAASAIALQIGVSVSYIEIVLSHLKKMGIVTGKSGAFGGYNLTKDDNNVYNYEKVLLTELYENIYEKELTEEYTSSEFSNINLKTTINDD